MNEEHSGLLFEISLFSIQLLFKHWSSIKHLWLYDTVFEFGNIYKFK